MEFQLEHQSFQRNPRADLLQNGLVGSPCSDLIIIPCLKLQMLERLLFMVLDQSKQRLRLLFYLREVTNTSISNQSLSF